MSASRLVMLWVICIALSGCGSGEEANDRPGAASAPVADIQQRLANADLSRGETLYQQCRACHSLREGEPHRVGPNLYGLFGKEAGVAPGFDFSEALSESELVWTAEALDAWLARPSEFLPGNKMIFIGIRDPADRASLIAWLQEATAADR